MSNKKHTKIIITNVDNSDTEYNPLLKIKTAEPLTEKRFNYGITIAKPKIKMKSAKPSTGKKSDFKIIITKRSANKKAKIWRKYRDAQ